MDRTDSTIKPKRRMRTALLAAASVLVLGAAAGAVLRSEGSEGSGGFLPNPAFSGSTWRLIVGEDANWRLTVGEAKNPGFGNFKVCYHFERAEEANSAEEANNSAVEYGVGGCGTWPSDVQRDSTILDIVPALDTPDGVVLFVDLTTEPVATVSVVLDDGAHFEVAPFVMPESLKQFAAIELPGRVATANVRLLDDGGNVIESRTITDLTVSG